MARDVPRLRELYCQARRSVNAEQCDTLDKVEADIGRLAAQKLVEHADAHPEDPSAYRAGAEKYMSVLQTYCLTTKVIRACDEVAYNAASAFIAAHDVDAAIRVRSLMVDPKNGMNKSPLTQRLICKLDPSLRSSMWCR